MAETSTLFPSLPEQELINMDSPQIFQPTRNPSILPKLSTIAPLPNLQDAVGPATFQQFPGFQPDIAPQPPKLFIPGVSKFYLDGKPIATYHICGKTYNMEQPTNETRSEFRRTTVNGHTLRYSLEVIQQPEKARACGAGPRSSADRRPVDPPPVVQLTVFDETDQQDITMFYDAGFMLYASLEVARPIAQGRMHNGPTMAVLTGVAVASTAYLDRPKQAGYFIFPDLSVRHEGWYRLKFSLFESIKHPQDADHDRPFAQTDTLAPNQAPVMHESMANRMEVQSTPFQVFSAKKFPGLNMSTQLSRVVAEQGCRVRIRREIRQRKRNADKPNADGNDEAQTPYGGIPEVPFAKPEHIRSASRNSVDSQFTPAPVPRPSLENLYTRPAPPSRNPSIASLTIPSPITPNTAQMTMTMPPPSAFGRLSAESTPVTTPYSGIQKTYLPRTQSPAPSSAYPQLLSPESNSNITLPPIHKYNGVGYNSVTRQYNLPEPSAMKRTHSPRIYDQSTSMKSGARPDTEPRPIQTFSATNTNDIIEADSGDEGGDSDDSLLDGDYTYSRADGSRGMKIAMILTHRR